MVFTIPGIGVHDRPEWAFTIVRNMHYFVEELLAPTLNRGEIVFMDNCAIHKMEEIEEAIEAHGACVMFLPRYGMCQQH